MTKSNRSNDAWATIRGFVYQVQLSIKYWINLKDDQFLELESIEDIDVITKELLKEGEDLNEENFERILGQVKHLDKNITLRTDAFKEALVNFSENIDALDKEKRQLLFLTNAEIGKENGVVFRDKDNCIIGGLNYWKLIQSDSATETESEEIDKIQQILFEKVPEKLKDKQQKWEDFKGFFSEKKRKELIKQVVISDNNSSPLDLKEELIKELRGKFYRNKSEASKLYDRLFTKIFEVISIKDEEKLSHKRLFTLESLHSLIQNDSADNFNQEVVGVVNAILKNFDRKIEESLIIQNKILDKIDRLNDRNLDNSTIPFINEILNNIENEIHDFKLKQSYFALQKLNDTIENSPIEQKEKQKLVARIFYLKGLAHHNGEECKESVMNLYKQAYQMDITNVKYQEKACWVYYSEEDVESAVYIAKKLLEVEPNNIYGNFIMDICNEEFSAPPYLRKEFHFRRLGALKDIVLGQRNNYISWKNVFAWLTEDDFEEPVLGVDLINFWRIIALGFMDDIYSGKEAIINRPNLKECFNGKDFIKFEKLINELYDFLSSKDAVRLRDEFIDVGWLHSIVSFFSDPTKEKIDNASCFLSLYKDKRLQKSHAFYNAILCYPVKSFDLLIEVSEKYKLDKTSLLGSLQVIAYLNLKEFGKAEKLAFEILSETKEVDEISFTNVFEIISHLPDIKIDPFPIINDWIKDIIFTKGGQKEFLIAWSYHIGRKIRIEKYDYELMKSLDDLDSFSYSIPTRIWIAEMESDGVDRHTKAKAIISDVLKDKHFKNDLYIIGKFYKYWYKSEEDKDDLLDQLILQRKENNIFRFFDFEFNILSAYRKYDEVIELCFAVIDKVTIKSKNEIIYSLTDLIVIQSPDRIPLISSLFTDGLVFSELSEDKKMKLSFLLGEAGFIKLGIQILYEEIKNTNSPLLKTNYFMLWAKDTNGELLEENDYNRLTLVNEDCVVQYQDMKSKKKMFLVISRDNGQKKELQQKFIGKRTGDFVEFKKTIGKPIRLQIINILGKYLGLQFLIIDETEQDLTSEIQIGVMKFDKTDLKKGLEGMVELAGGQERLEEANERHINILESFKKRELSFMELVNSIDPEQPIEIYQDLTLSYNAKFPCLLVPDKIEGINKEITVVLDFTTLIVVFDIFRRFNVLPLCRLVCSQTMVDFLKKVIHQLKNTNDKGFITFNNSTPRFKSYSEEHFIKKRKYYNDLVDWIEKNCTIEFSTKTGNLMLQVHKKGEELYEKLPLLELITDNATLSERDKYVLLSDDIFYWKHLKRSVLSIQSLIEYGMFGDNIKVENLLFFLLEQNYIGIKPSQNLFTETLIKCEVLTNLKPLHNLLEGTILYKKKGMLCMFDFLKEVYLFSSLSAEKREMYARIIFSYLLDMFYPYREEVKLQIISKLKVDFYLLPLYIDSLLNVFNREWDLKTKKVFA